MRDARETTLARRMSQQTPKTSPSPPQIMNLHASSPANSTNALPLQHSAAASPERAFKRSSVLLSSTTGSSPQGGMAGVGVDPASIRKKVDEEPMDFGFQRDHNLSSSSGAGASLGQHQQLQQQQQQLLSGQQQQHQAPSLAILSTSTTTTTATTTTTTTANSVSSQHLQQQRSSSTHSARTPLGSVLASTFGQTPASPSSVKSFKYPTSSTSDTFQPSAQGGPARKSSLMMNEDPAASLGGSGHGGGGAGGSFKSYTPNVFINLGRTSTSLPQILMPKKKVAQNIASNLSYIAAWYFFSTALSIYNKNLMGKDNWNFNLPLFVSSIHAGLHFVITACLMHFWPEVFDATRSGKGGRITIHSYVTQVVPCAVAAALEICMANASLMYITLSFYTMIKSSTPIWVLVFAFFFRLEKPRLSLIAIIAVIVVGVVLTVAGETQFDMTGFVLVLMASIMSGLRWSMTQMLLQKDDLGMDNPVATLYYISPIMFVLMSILSLVIEDPFVEFASSEFFNTFQAGAGTLAMAAGGGLLAFAMTVAEFKLIKNTGTVTLSVAGISKEIVVISLSMLIFGDRLTFVNLLGLLVSITGIMAYNYDKIKRMQQSSAGGDYEILGTGRHNKGDNTD